MAKSRLVTMMLVLSALCGYLGYTSGAVLTIGPCNTDATNTCTFDCILWDSNLEIYANSTDNTKVPYCAGTSGKKDCDPKAQGIKCNIQLYADKACTMKLQASFNNAFGCK